jgi:hypothetical protein
MPFFKHITLPNESQIGIWEITETLQTLIVQLGNSIEEPSKNNLKKEVHQLQWYASRLLLKYLFNEAKIILNKDEHNKPSLLIDGQPYAISITHAGKYAAVSVARNRKLGIDLEKVDERILRLLGLDFVGDIDYDTYLTLLNGAIVSGRNRLPQEELALLSNEKKRVTNKKGRFKPQKQKITASKIATTKFLKPSVQPISSPLLPAQVQTPQVQGINLSPLQEHLE